MSNVTRLHHALPMSPDIHYYKGNLNFDQFVLGATLAASAYLAQTQKYAMLGWNAETLLLIAE